MTHAVVYQCTDTAIEKWMLYQRHLALKHYTTTDTTTNIQKKHKTENWTYYQQRRFRGSDKNRQRKQILGRQEVQACSLSEDNKSLHPGWMGAGGVQPLREVFVQWVQIKASEVVIVPTGTFPMECVWCTSTHHYWPPGPNTGSCLSCCWTPFWQVTAGLWASQDNRGTSKSLIKCTL